MSRTMTSDKEPTPTEDERAQRILQAMSRLQHDRPRRSWAGIYWLLVILLLATVLVTVVSVGRRFRQYWQQLVAPEATTEPPAGP